MRSGGCGSSPGCAPTWCTSGPGTGRGWKSCPNALIKISPVASSVETQPVRAMLEALIAGQPNPKAPADLARGRMRARSAQLAEAPDGKFEPHHGKPARIMLDQIDALTTQIGQLTARISELIAAAQGIDADGTTSPGRGHRPGRARAARGGPAR